MKNWKEWIGKIIVEVIILIIVGIWTLSMSNKLRDYETSEHADKTFVKKEVQDEVNRKRDEQIRQILESQKRVEDYLLNGK
jgi:hypothetical protein